MVIDSFQKRFVMNTPVKVRFCLDFFDLQKKPKVFKKSQNFKIWLQKSQIGKPALKLKLWLKSNPVSVFFITQLGHRHCLATTSLILDNYLRWLNCSDKYFLILVQSHGDNLLQLRFRKYTFCADWVGQTYASSFRGMGVRRIFSRGGQ